jgi:hypothetical protein
MVWAPIPSRLHPARDSRGMWVIYTTCRATAQDLSRASPRQAGSHQSGPSRAPDLPATLFQVQEEQVGHLSGEVHVDSPVFREGDTHPEAREDAAQGPLSSPKTPFRPVYSPPTGLNPGSQGCIPA